MRRAGLQGTSQRQGATTTQPDQGVRAAPDWVERDFRADEPDELYVSDITYIPTAAGFLYLAVVLDVFSRRIVGWSMAAHPPDNDVSTGCPRFPSMLVRLRGRGYGRGNLFSTLPCSSTSRWFRPQIDVHKH